MKLTEVKAGDVCAYVSDYSSNRHAHWCSTSVRDACPVEIIEKVSVPMEIKKDSCGRAKVISKTMLRVNMYNIKASDMLAQDLDIIEEKHPKLMSEETIYARDLIWSWEEEVEKVREDIRVNTIISRFSDYLQGVCWVLAHFFIREYGFAKNIPDGSTFHISSLCHSLKAYLNDALREDKMTLMDATTYGLRSYLPSVVVGCDVEIGQGSGYTSRYRDFKLSFSKKLYPFFFLFNGLTYRDSRDDLYPTNKKLRTKQHNKQKKLLKKFELMTGTARIEFLTAAIISLIEEVEKSTGLNIPVFDPTKSWESWEQSQRSVVDDYRMINKGE